MANVNEDLRLILAEDFKIDPVESFKEEMTRALMEYYALLQEINTREKVIEFE